MFRLYSLAVLALLARRVVCQNNCYYGPGAGFRGPSNLVPCNSTAEFSSCCLAGDTCLTGNACYNYASGNTYQYGCTDANYADASCPQKCSWDPSKSPWIGLEYCNDIQDLSNTWTCLAPESCGCEWNGSYALQLLPSRGCGAMGSEARIALFAPSTLLPYVSLPATRGGSTGYYSTTTDSAGSVSIISTAVMGYTPATFTQPTTYRAPPSTASYINAAATASPSTLSPASIWTATTPPGSQAPYTPTTTLTQSSTSSTSAAASSSTTAASSSGLSTGAKAGIGVGVAAGVIIAGAMGVCWFLAFRRRRRNQQELQQPQNPQQQMQQSPQPPQYVQAHPAPYMQDMSGQSPMMHQGTNWAPVYPPGGMPYFVQPQHSHETKSSPPYSPPHSPPPTELSATEPPRLPHEADSVYSGTSPRLAAASPEVDRSRFSEGPV